VVPTGPSAIKKEPAWYAEYELEIPHRGRWYLWGRVKYKDTGSNSFFAALADQPESKQRFGNSYVWGKWLWDSHVMFRLDKGRARIRLYVRESAPNVSPLLDVICLTNDAGYAPSDELAKEPLGK